MTPAEAWTTDAALADARNAFAARIPNYRTPVAYALARKDGTELVFGHVNKLGAVRGLPAAALALECGYIQHSGTYPVTHAQVASVLECLTPAEAATHIPHPNIWTWRELLSQSRPDSTFVAFYWADAQDSATNADETAFLSRALGRD